VEVDERRAKRDSSRPSEQRISDGKRRKAGWTDEEVRGKPGTLRRVQVARLQFGQQNTALLGRTSPTHDLAPMDSLVLTGRRACVGVGLQIRREERFGMFAVSIQGQQERGSLLHDPDARVGMPVDAPLVTLGFSEEALQIQIVLRKVQEISPGEQARGKTFQDAGHVLTERIGIYREPDPDLIELDPTLLRRAVLRI